MTELEKLKTQLKTVIYREADGHHRHGAIVDALEAENARLRKALTVVSRGRHNNGRPMCRSDVRDIAHAALKETAHD